MSDSRTLPDPHFERNKLKLELVLDTYNQSWGWLLQGFGLYMAVVAALAGFSLAAADISMTKLGPVYLIITSSLFTLRGLKITEAYTHQVERETKELYTKLGLEPVPFETAKRQLGLFRTSTWGVLVTAAIYFLGVFLWPGVFVD